DAGVLNAVVGLLRHPRADVRARAASMVNQLAPPDAGPAVAAALHNETDPEAAAALLSAADRWPSEAIRAPAIRWLEAGGVAREPAVEALLALHRQGLL